MKYLAKLFFFGGLCCMSMAWGFFGHHRINRLAVFTLPPEMIGFYKKHISTLTESAVNPDRRRYSVAGEAPRHYIDMDEYGDSTLVSLPRNWQEAVEKYCEDTLIVHGILPWHIVSMYYQLRNAFLVKDPKRIVRISAELGHYIADAHVPLHTTSNYDGQKTGQNGIHALWESRLPELYSDDYDFFVGRAEYVSDVTARAWNTVIESSTLKDSVLSLEKNLFESKGNRKFGFVTKGKQTLKVVSEQYAYQYHQMLSGMVERRFRAAIKMTGDLWYTAWVEAGQPDMQRLISYEPTEEELKQNMLEVESWKKTVIRARDHE